MGGSAFAGYAAWLQAAAWVATAIGASLTGWQLRRQARQARATFMLELFRQWRALADERKVFSAFRATCEQELLRSHAKLWDAERLARLREVARAELGRMEDDPARHDGYQGLLEVLVFLEHVGLMVRRGYLAFEDVDGLLHGAVLAADVHCRGHVEELRKRSNTPAGLFEHFIFLADRTARAG